MLHPQDDNLATYAKKIKKDEAKIDWNTSAEKIHKKIMAFNAWPVAETSLSGERIRIHDSEFRELKVNGFPGNIKSVSKKFIEVFTKNGLLLIKKIQKNNSKVISVEEFSRAYDFKGKKFE